MTYARSFSSGWGAVAVAAATLMASVSGAYAQARPDTRQLTCAQAQALVKQRGSVVMTTGPTTFDKFVATSNYCSPDAKMLRPKFAPTKDNNKCAVGNQCFRSRNFR
ncbi:MAG: hypothetical protein RDA78_01475 [Roseibium sp.]|uniref:hypothetical protein n=1 Tax=Roseibium sp. TaxID=1936156 RepID=UPI003D9C0356